MLQMCSLASLPWFCKASASRSPGDARLLCFYDMRFSEALCWVRNNCLYRAHEWTDIELQEIKESVCFLEGFALTAGSGKVDGERLRIPQIDCQHQLKMVLVTLPSVELVKNNLVLDHTRATTMFSTSYATQTKETPCKGCRWVHFMSLHAS